MNIFGTRLARQALLCLCAAAALAMGGCVDRTLLLKSEPSGAAVILNGEPVGVTPVETPFKTYGVFEVIMSAPRHARLRAAVPIRPPWYERLPLDFFFENLWPLTLHDRQEVTLQLKPFDAQDESGIADREQQMRQRMLSGDGAATP